VYERTIVVVIADHGEELFDHGFNGHGHTVYDELLKVPFVIRFPGGRPRTRIDAQVRAMDLFPTVLDALGLPIPPNLQGVSRMPLLRGDPVPAAPTTEIALSEYVFLPPEQKSVRQRGLKLVYTPVKNEERAFDLVADPREQTDVAKARSGDLAPLRVVLEREVLSLIEGFRISARSARVDHRLRIRLESAKPFADVGLVASEAGETLVTSDGGRKIEVNFTLPASPERAIPWADEDILRFRIDDGEPFTVFAELEETSAPMYFFLGAMKRRPQGRPPWRITGNENELFVPYPPVVPPSKADDVRVALYRIRRPPMPVATLDEKTRESLRQLGYAE
jgi:hypothetical protein